MYDNQKEFGSITLPNSSPNKSRGQQPSRAGLSHCRDHAKLLHETECIIVGGVSGNFPVPELVHIAEAQLELPTGWRDISSRAMQGACERTAPDKLNNCIPFGGKHVSHFYAAIGEGGTKPQ